MIFPWESYYTIWTAIFHLPEEQFWHSTPRKVNILWSEYLRLTGQDGTEQKNDQNDSSESSVVYRDGKPYKRVKAKDADWIKNAF